MEIMLESWIITQKEFGLAVSSEMIMEQAVWLPWETLRITYDNFVELEEEKDNDPFQI